MAEFWIENGVLRSAGLEPGNLEHAIEKWRFIVQRYGEIRDSGGKDTCALCLEYRPLECCGCPVAETVLAGFCWDTPYEAYLQALERCAPDRPISPEVLQAARDELAFLQQLRERRPPWAASAS